MITEHIHQGSWDKIANVGGRYNTKARLNGNTTVHVLLYVLYLKLFWCILRYIFNLKYNAPSIKHKLLSLIYFDLTIGKLYLGLIFFKYWFKFWIYVFTKKSKTQWLLRVLSHRGNFCMSIMLGFTSAVWYFSVLSSKWVSCNFD